MKILQGIVGILALAATTAIKVGDKFPDVKVMKDFPPDTVDLTSRIADKKVLLVGLPGAFTPT